MCIHPSIVKYGIRLPGLRPIDAAPNGDRTEKWLRLDAYSSGYASIRVSAREPQFSRYLTDEPMVTIAGKSSASSGMISARPISSSGKRAPR
jgi:hypothetical protein